MREAGGPRILVTGFSSFPGVPANPTEALIGALEHPRARLSGFGDIHLAVLPVDYRALPAHLERFGAVVMPDIALHFGVSGGARQFAVETLARNRVCTAKPDNSGHIPGELFLRSGGDSLPSSLPVDKIVAGLAAQGLPAQLSDDAGDYLCNALFYLSRGAHCPPFAPVKAGFIHVPPFGTELADGSGRGFNLPLLLRGALAILDACVRDWRNEAAAASRRAEIGSPPTAQEPHAI